MGHHLGASLTVGRIGARLSLYCVCQTVISDTGRHKGTGNLGSATGEGFKRLISDKNHQVLHIEIIMLSLSV